MSTLTAAEITGRLPEGWAFEDDAINVTYAFEAYLDGVAFVSSVGAAADAANHHPDILLTYGEVTIELTSHDVGHVTERDLDLAAAIAAAAKKAGARVAE